MTVPNLVNRVDAVGNGSVSTYSYTFRIFAATDLVVTETVVATGVATTMILNTDYTVTGVGAAGGGSITLVAGNLPAGTNITIRRVLPLTQTTDLRNQGAGFQETLEDQFDRDVMIEQQTQEQVGRQYTLPVGEVGTTANTTLPALGLRKGLVLGWDPTTGAPIATAVSNTLVSAAMIPVVGAVTTAVARTALGFAGSGGTVQTANIEPAGLAAAAYAALSVGTAAIANLAVTTGKIALQAITTALIADGNVTTAKLDAAVFTTIFPTGGLLPFGGAAAPSGFLLCDGDAVSRTTYSGLFAVIGTSYGNGNGTTTFNVPNTKGRFLRGISDYANANGSGTAGSSNGTFTAHPYKQTGVRVRLSSGTLTGLSVSTDYWLIFVDANTLAFATSLANAIAGTKIAISGANSAVIAQYEDPDASTRVSSTGGAASGATNGSLQTEQLLSHTHGLPHEVATNGGVGGNQYGASTGAFTSSATGGNETRPYNLGVNYIIKT